MEHTRYIDKETKKWYRTFAWSSGPDGGTFELIGYYDKNTSNRITLTGKELDERFDKAPWPPAIVELEEVKPRHPIKIVLRCPECGSVLETDGSAYLTCPLKYEHTCSNPDCKYEKCTKSYYSGMICLLTDEQEEKIKNGTYNEFDDGRLIKIKEADLWKFNC